jgi:hypothetical protein
MERYDFEVRQGDDTIASERCVELRGPKAVWRRIGELASKSYAPGCRIRVTNQGGEIVMLIGIATARRSFAIGALT